MRWDSDPWGGSWPVTNQAWGLFPWGGFNWFDPSDEGLVRAWDAPVGIVRAWTGKA